MSTQLPDAKSSDIELTQPTHEEAVEQTRLNSTEWKGALSLSAYLGREEHLGKQKLIRDGGLTSWALVTKDGNSRVVLSSCETIRKKALVVHNGQVREVICHGVASVFCPPEYRGKGYAGRMIRDLGERLRNWQTDDQNCLFSVLYSDIGKVRFIERCCFIYLYANIDSNSMPHINGSHTHLLTSRFLRQINRWTSLCRKPNSYTPMISLSFAMLI
jgi:hypothetical protein